MSVLFKTELGDLGVSIQKCVHYTNESSARCAFRLTIGWSLNLLYMEHISWRKRGINATNHELPGSSSSTKFPGQMLRIEQRREAKEEKER